jgi:hypothetical protein|tara:strand:- start:333 stop:452 length:120 start_codon:yes stop_codon:yes gene_type:complete
MRDFSEKRFEHQRSKQRERAGIKKLSMAELFYRFFSFNE